MDTAVEIEVKFHLADREALRRRIIRIGAAVAAERVFEINWRYDDARRSLLKNAALLRLRRDTRTTLTYKSKPRVADRQFTVQNELEVKVSCFSTMDRILQALGYRCRQIYEKQRETYVIDETLLCLDTMPYGEFLEIEGSPERIKDLAERLNLDWIRRIVLNYLEIFEIIRQRMNLPFSDVTFENFSSIEIWPEIYRSLTVDG